MKQISECVVLIVEDERVNRELLVKTLGPVCSIVEASDGLAGLEKAEEYHPDLILLDIMLPGMDGLSLCQKLKKQPSTKDIPIIFISGLGDNDDEYQGFELGAVDYIIKPVWPALVRARVENQLKLRLAQYELKELYNKTLLGGVHVIADLLSLSNQTAFGQAHNVRRLAKSMANDMNRPNPWKHDLAAQFANLGCIHIPQDVLHRIIVGDNNVTEEEYQMYDEGPALSARLIRKIPHLEDVATLIEGHRKPYDPELDSPLGVGCQIVRTAIEFHNLQIRGVSHEDALSIMRGSVEPYDPSVLASLERVLKIEGEAVSVFELPPDRIRPGMILDQDVHSVAGVLLAAEGMEVDEVVMKIMDRLTRKGNRQRIRVRVHKECESEDKG